jgi:hypothetical protein
VQIEPGRRVEGAALDTDGVPGFLGAGSEASGYYHCADCGYGISVRRLLPVCPMCRGSSWEDATSSPFTRLRV